MSSAIVVGALLTVLGGRRLCRRDSRGLAGRIEWILLTATGLCIVVFNLW